MFSLKSQHRGHPPTKGRPLYTILNLSAYREPPITLVYPVPGVLPVPGALPVPAPAPGELPGSVQVPKPVFLPAPEQVLLQEGPPGQELLPVPGQQVVPEPLPVSRSVPLFRPASLFQLFRRSGSLRSTMRMPGW